MRKRLDRVRKDCEWDEMQESRVNDGRSGDRRTKWEILASRNKKKKHRCRNITKIQHNSPNDLCEKTRNKKKDAKWFP